MYISDVNAFLSLMPLTAIIMYCTIYTARKIRIKKEILYITYIGTHKSTQSIGAFVFTWTLWVFSKKNGF